MSSNEDDIEGERASGAHGSKKRKIQRACDSCRRRKSDQMAGNSCANCVTYNTQCTYVESAKKRGPSKGYVEGLEHKLEKMEKLLRRLCPDEAVYRSMLKAMDGDNGFLEPESLDPKSMSMMPSTSLSPDDESPTLLDSLTRAIRNSHLGQDAVGGDEDFGIVLADLKGLAVEHAEEHRFFGKSSGAMLIRKVIEAKREYAGPNKAQPVLRNIRPEFWIIPEWEKSTRTLMSSRQFDYPPADLSEELIDHYFRHVNLYLPLLHRPTFQEAVKVHLHHTDTGFASVYMLVCSLGAKFSNDPRVKCDGQESSHSAGWKWFNQTLMAMKTPMSPANLYDIQSYALAVQFAGASASPQNCWTMIGIGLRVAQDVGAHIKRPRNRSAAEDELWKRAFWVLFVLDRFFSASLGRPCAVQEEDFDLDLPNDCNDEYWVNEDPAKCFRQPQDVPSQITAFVLLIKLMRILSVVLRSVYAINKSKLSWGYGKGRWEETVIAELDSALNSWVDFVPPYLRWDPNRENTAFFDQSVMLYSNYYFLQIIIHRPFIPTPNKPSNLSFPSLAICANAARSCSHLSDVQRRRTMVSPINQMPFCTAAIILLLNLWSGKSSGLSAEVVQKNMEDVLMCMKALKSVEGRWQAAGRLWDILYELAYVGDLPLPEPKPASSNKRPRGSNGPQDFPQQNTEALPNGTRNIAGSRRAHKDLAGPKFSRQGSPVRSHHASPGSNSSISDPSFDSPSFVCSSLQPSQCENVRLPMYGKELGQLPPHGPFQFGGGSAPHHHHRPQLATQTTPSPASTSGWYPYAENTGLGSSPYATSSSSSLHHQQQPLGELGPLTGSSEPAMNPGMNPMRGYSYPVMVHREPSMTSQDSPYDAPPPPPEFSAALPLHQPVQRHPHPHHQMENMSQMSTQEPMPGIDLSNDVMSMWLNASPSLLMDDLGAYFTMLGQYPQG